MWLRGHHVVSLNLVFITAFSASTSQCCKGFDGTCHWIKSPTFPLGFHCKSMTWVQAFSVTPMCHPAQQDPVRLQETSYINVIRAIIHLRKACYLQQQKSLLNCFPLGVFFFCQCITPFMNFFLILAVM